jgi:hypothetical protein
VVSSDYALPWPGDDLGDAMGSIGEATLAVSDRPQPRKLCLLNHFASQFTDQGPGGNYSHGAWLPIYTMLADIVQ